MLIKYPKAGIRVGSLVFGHGKSYSNASFKQADCKSSTPNQLKMKAWQIHSYGNLEELQFTNKQRQPQIRCSSECLVKVKSTTVNPIDVAMTAGYGAQFLNVLRCQPNEIEFPLTLGREFCGQLIQKGMGANKKLKTGQRVWGVVPVHSSGGSHAEYVVVPDYCLSAAPDSLNDEEAASVLYAGLTAWSGLYISAQLGGVMGALSSSGGGQNKRVLILGGAGSVGSLAIQILKSQNVEVVATCAEDALELVRSFGADHVVDYCNPIELKTLSSCAPYDAVLDCAGQGPLFAKTFDFKYNQYVTFSSPLLRNIDSAGLGLGLLKNISNLLETNVNSLSQQGSLIKWGFFTPSPHGIEFLSKLVERKKLIPSIDSRFDFDQLPEAFKKVEQGHLRGKVVVNLK